MVSIYLVIEKGLPYEPGTPLVLEKEDIRIGRSDNNGIIPDISFNSLFISREHCCVRYVDGEWYLLDIKGKRGTWINGKEAKAAQSYLLQDGDQIILAENIAIIRFRARRNRFTTCGDDIWPPDVNELIIPHYRQTVKPIYIDVEKMELYVKEQCIYLAPKEWRLLELLYRKRNKVVDYDTIRLEVWPERKIDENYPPDVAQQEVALLIYRLREKMGECRDALKVKKGRGCILDY